MSAKVVRLAAALAWLLVLPCIAAPTGYAGLPLREALRRLEAQGLKILFSDELVRPEMIVGAEPPPGSPRETLDRLLEPWDLRVEPGARETLLIVRSPPMGRLRGVVRDDRTGFPLTGVVVEVGGKRAFTDARGTFRMHVPAGAHGVRAARAGYFPAEAGPVEVAAEESTSVDIVLTAMSIGFEEVVVTSEGHMPAHPLPEPRTTFTADSVENSPKMADDALRSIERLPGVASRDESAIPNIRGGVGDETLFVLDGLELYEPFHLDELRGFASLVDARIVGRLDYLNGGFPAEYGGRMSGVVDVSSLTPSREPGLAAALATDGGWIRGQGPLGTGQGGWLVSARVALPEESIEHLGIEENANAEYGDLFAKVAFDVGPRTLISIHALGSWDDFETDLVTGDGTSSEPYDSSRESRYLWGVLRRNWSARLFSRTTISYTNLDRRRVADDGVDLVVFDRRATRVIGVKQDWIHAARRHTVTAGWDFKNLRTNYDYISDGGALSRDPNGWDIGAYLSERLRLGAGVELEAGVRFDRQNYAENNDDSFSPRLNLSWKPVERGILRAAWGYFHQPQRIDELQIEDGVTTFAAPQRSEHLLLGYEHEAGRSVRMRFGIYRNDITRISPRFENLFDPLGVVPEAAEDRVRIAPDSAEAKGFETYLNGGLDRPWSWWVSYTLAAVDDRVQGMDVPRSWDQRHTGSAGWSLERGRWRFDASGLYRTGRPTTPVSGTLVTLPDGSQEVQVEVGERNSERLSDYRRIDVSVRRTFALPGSELEVRAQVLNLFGTRNICCVEGFEFTPQPDGSVDTRTRTRGSLSRFVVLGVAWSF